MNKKRVILVIAIVIVAIVAVYFTFFYTSNCKDIGCFNSGLKDCKRVSYLKEAEDASWFYKIKRKKAEECIIDVKLMNLKSGTLELLKLEGKEMTCHLPLNSVANPEENLARCNGLLKEEMQDIIINKLHNYITDNLGQIAEELKKAV